MFHTNLKFLSKIVKKVAILLKSVYTYNKVHNKNCNPKFVLEKRYKINTLKLINLTFIQVPVLSFMKNTLTFPMALSVVKNRHIMICRMYIKKCKLFFSIFFPSLLNKVKVKLQNT